MMAQVFLLLVLFQIKHFLCDYPFQTAYMLQKSRYTGWVVPLLTHAWVHAMGTFSVCFAFRLFGDGDVYPMVGLVLAGLDFTVHFAVDRVKASPYLGGRWAPRDRFFWWALGADQSAHHLTHYAIIYFLVRGAA